MKAVVRGFILPERGPDNNPQYSLIITRDQTNKMYTMFKELIKELIEDYKKLRNKVKIDSYEELSNLLNYMILKLKSLLYIDPTYGVLPPPIAAEYYIESLNKKFRPLYTYEGLKQYHEVLENFKGILNKNIERSEIIRSLLDFPADTRVGCNTSSLIIHMLTTAGITTSLGIQSGFDRNRLAILRFVSLFHDVGKFRIEEWHRHEDISYEFIEETFKGQFSEELEKSIYGEVYTILKERKGDINNIFRMADRIASGIDRLKEYLDRLIERVEEGKVLRSYIDKFGAKTLDDVFNNWSFWNSITLDDKKKLTEVFCKNIDKLRGEISKEQISEDLLIGIIDIRGIQSYIRSDILRIINAGSRIIEIFNYFSLPFYLMEQGLFPENVLYFGGGNLVFVLPANKRGQIENGLAELSRKSDLGINIAIAFSKLFRNFEDIIENLERELALNKLFDLESKSRVELNIYRRCESCGERKAEYYIRNIDKHLCKLCNDKLEIEDYLHFSARLYRLLPHMEDPDLLLKILKDPMIYIAGHPAYEIDKKPEEYKNLSMIRFDGNLMGYFMSSSVSITDAHERSIRIDFSVKKAVGDFIGILKDINKEDYKRLVLGIMYLGGDDGVILTPSIYAIPLSLWLLNEFYLNMGCKSTLSVSVITVKPKHPIIDLYEACGRLLNHVKSKSRSFAYNVINEVTNKPSDTFRGSIGFYSADGGFVNKDIITWYLKLLSSESVSIQYDIPYILGNKISNSLNVFNIFSRIISFISKDLNIDYNNFDKNNLVKLLKIINNIAYKEGSENENIKKLRNLLLDSLYANIQGESTVEIKIIHSQRQFERKEEEMEYGKIIMSLIYFNNNKLYFNLYDLLMLLKALSGGIV